MDHPQLALIDSVVTLAAVAVSYWRLRAHQKKHYADEVARRVKFDIEHEMLVVDFCDRKGIERKDLPTRHKPLNGDKE